MRSATPLFVSVVAVLLTALAARGEEPYYRAELIFPLESWHNHASSLVEAPNGDLLVVWYHGSGERRADDVVLLGARRVKVTGEWSAPFLMADTPGFPDTNPTLLVDPRGRLWLFWATILANQWESALMKYRISTDYMMPEGPPVWRDSRVLHMKPGEDFEAVVRRKTEEYLRSVGVQADDAAASRALAWAERNYQQAADKLTRRLGWFTRPHPYVLDDSRLLVGLYSDGFSFSSAVFTDDWGETWRMSEPIVGGGNIQPSFARRRDGTLVALMRDNGPPPKRAHVAESRDRGETWTVAWDHPELADPGAGNEVLRLTSGRWIVIHNDTERGRHSLAISVSEDEGKTFPHRRHLELVAPGEGSFHYPSVIQSRDGRIHTSYSYFKSHAFGESHTGKAIKHAEFDEAWILAGDPQE